MAKAIFHKSQRVFVKPIGTWANIEQVIPQWAQGVDEPIRVHYDVGMGKKFSADELESEGSNDARAVSDTGEWRVVRGQNKWRTAEDCPHHPYPGTHPLIVTSEQDWGGWRVPGAEYNRDPVQVEQQAMMIAKTPTFAGILIELVKYADEIDEDLPSGILELARRANEQLSEAGICATDESHDNGEADEPHPVVSAPAEIESDPPVEIPAAATLEAAELEPALDRIRAAAGAATPAVIPEPAIPDSHSTGVEAAIQEASSQQFGQRVRPVAQPLAQEMPVAGAHYQRPD